LEAEIKQSVYDLYGVNLEREPVQLPSLMHLDHATNLETLN
jgi:UDP-N-acetylmuramate dehydrogenase